jgi:hypothetical protein
MAKAELAKSPHARGHKMPTKDKPCQYPDCGKIFNGIGASKYCLEHRKPEYRKVLNKLRAKEKKETINPARPELSNVIITHTHIVATKDTRTCPCGKEFEITLYPGVPLYPEFCEDHRNPYRRNRLLESLGIKKQIDPGTTPSESLAADVEMDEETSKQLNETFGEDASDSSSQELY